MNYQRIYNQLIQRAKSRELAAPAYFERHHIIPKCKDGSDDPSNIVNLTAREHFLAHWLLHKIEPKNFRLLAAWNAFCQSGGNTKRVTSHLYEYVRVKWINELKNRKETHPEWWERYTKHAVGTIWMNDGSKNARVPQDEVPSWEENGYVRGRLTFNRKPHSPEHRALLSAKWTDRLENGWTNPRKGKKLSTTTALSGIQKMIQTRLENGTYKHTKEEREKIQEQKRLDREQNKFATCPHCGKHGVRYAMIRWHFDNCREKGNYNEY